VLARSPHVAVGSAPLRIQRFSGQANGQMDAAPPSVDQTLARPGRRMEPALRHDMEQRFGHNFSRVRVHTDTAAERSARDADGHQATLRYLTQRLSNFPAEPPGEYRPPETARVAGVASSAASDFSKVPVFSPERINQSRVQSRPPHLHADLRWVQSMIR